MRRQLPSHFLLIEQSNQIGVTIVYICIQSVKNVYKIEYSNRDVYHYTALKLTKS